MLFHYKAQKKTGEVVEGEKESPDKFVLFDELKKEDLVILSTQALGGKKKMFEWKRFFAHFNLNSVPIHQKIVFAKNLAAMIDAGLPLSRALSVIERQINNKMMKKVIGQLNEEIRKGSSFSDSLSKFPNVFSSLFISIVKAGEEGGNLSTGLRIITGQLERIYFLQRKIRGALMYPALVVSLIIIVGVLMFVFVVPKLTAAFSDMNITLPLTTRIVIFSSNFLKNNFLLSIGIFVLVVVGVWMFAQTKKGKRAIDFVSIKIPLIGTMIKETNTARAARTLSSLLASGVNVVDSLQITSDVVQNSYFRDILLSARENIQKGTPLVESFTGQEKIYPPFFAEMVAAGEETGNLSEMLSDVGTFYENEVDEKTKDFSTIIEPFIMIVIGAAVGFFALAMLSPMYSMMGSIQ